LYDEGEKNHVEEPKTMRRLVGIQEVVRERLQLSPHEVEVVIGDHGEHLVRHSLVG